MCNVNRQRILMKSLIEFTNRQVNFNFENEVFNRNHVETS